MKLANDRLTEINSAYETLTKESALAERVCLKLAPPLSIAPIHRLKTLP